MEKKKSSLLSNILFILVALAVAFPLKIYLSEGKFRQQFQQIVSDRKITAFSTNQMIITETRIKNLPEIVQKYLKYTGSIGKTVPSYAMFRFKGQMRTGNGKPWMPIEATQYNFFNNPARAFFIKGSPSPLLFMRGLDTYLDGKGNMLIKLYSIFKIADSKGPEMDASELITFLNDMCFVPAAVTSPYITWQALDKTSVKATITDKGNSASAVYYFKENGELTNFITQDRYRDENGKNIKETWTTPLGKYTNISGILVPADGEATHESKDGPYSYVKLTLEELKTY